MEIDETVFRELKQWRKQRWALLDDVLYELCTKYPRHTDPAIVNAKVTIIGRTYATGIERKVPSEGGQASSILKLTSFIHKHAAKFDSAIGRLRRLEEPLTVAKLGAVVEEHGRLVKVLLPVLYEGQTPRSFVSKYLHFHAPVVPVYDSFAADTLRGLARWKDEFQVIEGGIGDATYASFVMRFWQVYQEALRRNLEPTVKSLDYFLLSGGGREPRPSL